MLTDTTLLPGKRHREILELLEREPIASVRDIAKQLGVVQSTIRRDLQRLESKGLIKRTYGGAVLVADDRMEEPSFHERQVLYRQEKDRIGRAAAALVSDGDALFLDGGTTTECLVPYLLDRKGLTVVTCGLNVAVRLSKCLHITTILIGGELHIPTLSFTGVLAEKAMKSYQLHFNKCFIAAGGVSAMYGITNPSVERVPIKREAMRLSHEVMVLADSSKIGKAVIGQVAPVTAANQLITGESALPAEVEAISAQDVPVTMV